MLRLACGRCASLVLFAIVFTSSGATAETYNTKNVQAHGEWYSMYLYLGDDRQGRAITTKPNGERLVLDIPVGQCNGYFSELQVTFDSSSDKTTTAEALGVRARIDKKPVHELDAKIHLRRGEKVMYIPFSVSNPDRFWREIRMGGTIRFEIDMNDRESAYASFSLDGSAAATARAQSICKQHSPSSYFDDDERERKPTDQGDKPDSSYF